MRKKAIFFDLFETLITEYDPDWKPKPDLSSELTREVFNKHWSVRRKQMELNKSINFVSITHEILKETNCIIDNQVIQDQYQLYLQDKIKLYQNIPKEIIETIYELKKLGYMIGLISNLSQDDFVGWIDCDLACFFDTLTLSFQIEVLKPDTQIFEVACKSINIRPEECIYVGDGGSNELSSARAFGMETYYASWYIEKWPSWKKTESGRDNVNDFQRLSDIKELVNIAKMAW
ncbi:HAD family hydrolase [Paenibacillus segetis]|uniref:Hydrolase of the HAD superfamily n=1 Tax=Paenibacillus segetis TaxID=1325360 RepID=A0ABQ1YIT1_9BACL|nr:HAD family hydrolase [Paenibacillus segetis]GGH27560.1 hypothetical protein GCM10008013_29100 [Paenibacillus segetis]